MPALNPNVVRKALGKLISLVPEDANVQQVQYAAIAGIDDDVERRNAYVEMLEDGPVVLEPAAGWLRGSSDLKVRTAAWGNTRATLAEARAALGTERSRVVRTHILATPGFTSAERKKVIAPLTEAIALAVVEHYDTFEPGLVLDAIRFLWAIEKLPAYTRDRIVRACTSPELAEMVVDADDLAVSYRIDAVAMTDPSHWVERLTAIAQAAESGQGDRLLVPQDAESRNRMVAAIEKLTERLDLSVEALDQLDRFDAAVKVMTYRKALSKARKNLEQDPAHRAQVLDLKSALRYLEMLTDPEDRSAAAAAVLFRSNDTDQRVAARIDPDATVFSLLAPYLADSSEDGLIAAAAAAPSVGFAAWMMAYPNLVFWMMRRHREEVLKWEPLRAETDVAAALRDRYTEDLLAADLPVQNKHASDLIRAGWLTDEDLLWLTPVRLMDYLGASSAVVAPGKVRISIRTSDEEKALAAPVLQALFAQLAGESPEQARANLDTFLTIADDTHPVGELMQALRLATGHL